MWSCDLVTEFAAYPLQVQNVARHAFAELVERASACDRIRGVLALIKRHENLFRLPTRIRHATERGLYDQVMRQSRHLAIPLHSSELPLPQGIPHPRYYCCHDQRRVLTQHEQHMTSTVMVQVITEYRKARTLMGEDAATPKGGVWHSLFQEVEKVRMLPANVHFSTGGVFCARHASCFTPVRWHM